MKEKQGIINLYKRIGETPKERLERFKKENPLYADATLSYAGRLDPMSEGVLLALVDEENKKRTQYLSFTKDYVCEILWGFSTDTYDILGITHSTPFSFPETFDVLVEEEVKKLHDETPQHFPAYPSKPVLGKPLFQWAREGKINEIEIPLKDIHVENAYVVSHNAMHGKVLLSAIEEKISKISGNFRQDDIVREWRKTLAGKEGETFRTTSVFFSVTSGTYIRGLVHLLGQNLACGATILSLTRTRVGEYAIDNA